MKKVPRREVTRKRIREVIREGTAGGEDPKNVLIKLGIQSLAEEALEAAVRDLLGRDYYERGSGRGWRNGYRRGRLWTAEGEVSYGVPQVRGADTSRMAELRALLSGRTEALEDLVVEMYARGCSTRDIEAIFGGLLSRTGVSELTERLWEEYEAFATRDLSEIKPLYLFLDGLSARLTPGYKREAVLVAWCITWEGRKVLIHIAPGTKESGQCCYEFIQEMKRRGLSEPPLVVTDGAPGLISAVEQCFGTSLRQRCLAHKMRNLASKLPDDIRVEFEQAARASYQAPSKAMARALREDLVERFEKRLPTAVRCFQEDFEACIAHLDCPPAHRRSIRTTNLLERLFEEERRRTKAAPTLFGERPVLKLMFASLIRASDRWRGLRITELERHQLERLYNQLHEGSQKIHEPLVKPQSTPNQIYSKDGT